MKRAVNKRLTLHELKKKVPFALAFLRAVTTSSLKNTEEISAQRLCRHEE